MYAKIRKIGIYGYGAFAKLMAEILSEYFEVLVYSRSLKVGEKDEFADYVSEKELAEKADALILSLPVQFLEGALADFAQQNPPAPQTPIIDVSSVKVFPLQIIKKHFPQNPILGTHPIFGPQSVKKHGLTGSKIVLCNESFDKKLYDSVKRFLLDKLALQVLEKTAQEHDKEMAYAQGITHMIGRALAELKIPDLDTSTFSYQHLLDLKELLKDDSWELFESIQKYNPHTESVRADFLSTLESLEKKLQDAKM